MHKYSKFVIYVFIGLIAFTFGYLSIQQITTSTFKDGVIVPTTQLSLGNTSVQYQHFKHNYLIATEYSENNESKVDLAKDIDYLNLAVFSNNSQINIYGGDDLKTIADNDPLLTCTANSACSFESDGEYNYYLISSDGRVDMRIISGEESQDN